MQHISPSPALGVHLAEPFNIQQLSSSKCLLWILQGIITVETQLLILFG